MQNYYMQTDYFVYVCVLFFFFLLFFDIIYKHAYCNLTINL